MMRTPDDRFLALPGWPYPPRYLEVDGGLPKSIRVHYVDEGPRDGPPVLMLHGEPSWSYLYRKVIPVVAGAGLRAIAVDLVGFGRSDKPERVEDYTYARHVAWMAAVVQALGLEGATLVGQDWGGLIGLRLVAAEPDRWARVVAANTALPTGDQSLGKAFEKWREHVRNTPDLPVGSLIAKACARPVAPEVVAAYDAPFPDQRYKAGARAFPALVPSTPDDPEAPANRAAWEVLRRFERPFLTVWGDEEKITRGANALFEALIPGAAGQAHRTLARAGHYLQEDAGEELGAAVVDFVRGRK